MPTVTGPDGRKLRFPEGTDPATVMAVLQQQYPDADFGSAAGQPPAPATPPGAGLPAAPGPAPGGPGMVAATPTPGAPPGAPETAAPLSQDERTAEQLRQFLRGEMAQEPWYSKLAAGMGSSVDSTIRGGRQLWNMATGDDEELAQLRAEEAEHRRINEPLLETGWGRTGQVGGMLAEMAVPGGAIAKGTKALTAGIPRAAQLASVIGAESGLGALAGAIQPTVEGESHGDNAALGAALGAGARAAPSVLGAAARVLGAKTGLSPFAGALSQALRRYSGAQDPAKDAVRRAAGEKIGEITQGVNVPLSPMAPELAAIRSNYGSAIPGAVRDQLETLENIARQHKSAALRGVRAQEMRTAVAREASDSGGITQSGLERLMRALDKGVEGQLTAAQIRALRQARNEYRTGLGQPGMGYTAPAVIGYGVTADGE